MKFRAVVLLIAHEIQGCRRATIAAIGASAVDVAAGFAIVDVVAVEVHDRRVRATHARAGCGVLAHRHRCQRHRSDHLRGRRRG